ncbi:hypothetical protein [Thermodesulfovibrio yellowstonii]|uniref:Uncharacterized protein n=1 Tax=Thermodesulfovibrio yellowstonii TaxID=28262 RepID=A0A9W6GHA0_9BACT|nr:MULTISPECIES: hypothetical protein [Thermodesulfovibrio]MDI6864287.1 hypothetical protein [Thermodesulfovibrio yellowstonii]GLI54013.1 hypothetical protein TISLANDTSLP1_17060 [Thermodesulfovibrio islandicus]
MIKISIDKAKPGMKIAKDIVNEAGMVVITAGKELTDALIEKLSIMNIDFVYVEGQKEMPPKEEVFEEIEKRFKKTTDSYTLLIKKALKTHIEELYK